MLSATFLADRLEDIFWAATLHLLGLRSEHLLLLLLHLICVSRHSLMVGLGRDSHVTIIASDSGKAGGEVLVMLILPGVRHLKLLLLRESGENCRGRLANDWLGRSTCQVHPRSVVIRVIDSLVLS